MFRPVIVILLLCAVIQPVWAADLKVVIEGAPEPCGPLMVALFDSKQDFLKRPAQSFQVEQAAGAVIRFTDLAKGRYAVSAYCDLNQNGEIDFGESGRPIEPSAVSGKLGGQHGPPQFRTSAVHVGSREVSVSLWLR